MKERIEKRVEELWEAIHKEMSILENNYKEFKKYMKKFEVVYAMVFAMFVTASAMTISDYLKIVFELTCLWGEEHEKKR